MMRLRRWLIPLLLVVALVVATQVARTRLLAAVQPRLGPAPTAAAETPANPAARALEELAVRVKVGLAPRGAGRANDETTLGDLRDALNRHFDGQIARPALPLDPAPPEVERFLAEHDADLAAIETALLTGETPRWESGLDLPVNLGGHAALHRLLLTRALEATRRSDPEAAARAIEASHRLRQSLLGPPDLVRSGLLTTVTKLEAGTLRKLESLPPDWLARLAPESILEPRAAAFSAAARSLFAAARDGDREALITWYARKDAPIYRYQVDRLLNPLLVRPLMADTARRMQDLIDELAATDPCHADADAIESAHRAAARWNPLAARIVPELAGTWLRTGRAALDLELTAIVLRYKGHRHAAPELALDPAAVTTALGDLASKVCPGRKWTVAADAAAGTLKIALDGTPAWTPPSGAMLPLSYEEYAAAVPGAEPAAVASVTP
jgi:hypothetical protein